MEALLAEPRMSTVNFAEVVTRYVLRGRGARANGCAMNFRWCSFPWMRTLRSRRHSWRR